MDPEFVKLLVLAVVQGITEFLPISSSGHLVIGGALLGTAEDDRLAVNIVLHAGTLLSILAYYWRDLLGLCRWSERRTVALLALGTAPAVVVALGLKVLPKLAAAPDAAERSLDAALVNPWLAVGCLVVTAVILLQLHRPRGGDREWAALDWRDALFVGLVQCVAILPGISRSGSTIATGTRRGLDGEAAAKLSFFLGIPALVGAILFDVKDIAAAGAAGGGGVAGWQLAIGFAISASVGYAAICWLMRLLRRGHFAVFGYYCLGAAAISMILLSRQPGS